MACRQKLMSILVLGALFLGAFLGLSAPQETVSPERLAAAINDLGYKAGTPIVEQTP